jgi:hypothetical protein
MKASRGMGDINPSKVPSGKKKPRRDNTDFTEFKKGGKVNLPGLYANINAKKKRIAGGSGEKMRKVGSKGAPSKQDFIDSLKTAKK